MTKNNQSIINHLFDSGKTAHRIKICYRANKISITYKKAELLQS